MTITSVVGGAEATALLPRTTVSEIVAARDAAIATYGMALRAFESACAFHTQAQSFAERAHAGHHSESRRELANPFCSRDDVETLAENYRRDVDSRTWGNLMTLVGMRDLMDRTALDEWRAQNASDTVPPVTEENVFNALSDLAERSAFIFQRGLARAFIELDSRFRSHDAFKLKDRIILRYIFDEWGSLRWGPMLDTLRDVERVFAVLDSQNPDGVGLISALNAQRRSTWSPKQTELETPYFRIKGYKNGNAHLWFTRPDLVAKANAVLADFYGATLPDAWSQTAHEAELKSVAGLPAKDLQFYPTPDAVVAALLRHVAYLPPRAVRVLEPSAGEGNIARGVVRTIPQAQVTAVEIHPNRAAVLRSVFATDPRVTVTCANFLTMQPTADYDLVVMNPPFYGTHWMEHVVHAFDFLAPRRQLIAVLPVSAELGDSEKHETFRAWAAKHDAKWHPLPLASFAESGTRVSTVILSLWKS